MHKYAADARATRSGILLNLEARMDGEESRNGARVYLAERCVESRYDNTYLASLKLIGSTLSFTIDLSGAGCGCNVGPT